MERPKLTRDLTSHKWDYCIKNYLINNKLNNNDIIYLGMVDLNNSKYIRYYIKIIDNIWYKSIITYNNSHDLLEEQLYKINHKLVNNEILINNGILVSNYNELIKIFKKK